MSTARFHTAGHDCPCISVTSSAPAGSVRLLQGEGLASDQIKDRLLSNGFFTMEVWNKMIELKTALSAKERKSD